MPFRTALAVVLALLLVAPAAAGAQGAHSAQGARPVENAAAPALSAAAQQLLELVQLQVDDGAVELGSKLILEHPDDAALHALYAVALSGYGGRDEALALSEQYAARWPNDAWVLAVRGTLMWTHTSGTAADAAEARALAERARQLAPDDPDVASWVVSIYSAYPRYEQAIALADSFIASGHATAELRLAKASAMSMLGRLPTKPDTAMQSRTYVEYAAAREQWPHQPGTYLAEGRWLLSDRRAAEALPLLERAVQLSPHSNPIRRAYWDAISARSDIGADEKRSLISADMEAYLETRGHALGARFAVAQHLRAARDFERLAPLWDSIEREHSGTWQAAQVVLDRALLSADSAFKRSVNGADSIAVHRRIADDMRRVLEIPGINSSVRNSAHGRLYRTLGADSSSSADELLSVFSGFDGWHVREKYVTLPVLLAERGAHLELAEELARGALDAVQEYDEQYEQWPDWFTVAELAEWMDNGTFGAYSTLGWVLFHRGDLAEAKRQLEKAHDIVNTHPVAPYRLGRIAEAEGDIETAERWYASGRGREDWNRNSSDALERLYSGRHGSLEGFETYLAAIDEREFVRRRAKVESDRIAEPEPLPDFEHDWMNGGRFSSESLEGKVAVINFWGVWCGPCVREAPEIQKFAEEFRYHPDVVFITVANDNDLDTTRGFMKEKGYDFPVVFDEGLVRMVNISAFPTTLFVDRDGRIVYRYVGASLRLVEEYTLRVEALLGGSVTDAGDVHSADLESAIARVRSLYFAHDFQHGAAEGEAALGRWPESSELAAWTVANLAGPAVIRRGGPSILRWDEAMAAEEALARAESLVASRPDDVWGAIALALALSYHSDRRGEAQEVSLRALELAPTLPEAVWVRGVVLHDRRQYREVATLIEERWPVVDRQWPELLILKGNAYLAMDSEGPERRAEGLEILAGLRECDPENVNAHYLAGVVLFRDRLGRDEGAALLERAATLSPGSTGIVFYHWITIANHPGLDAEEKKAMISAAASELVERRGQYAGILREVASRLAELGRRQGLGDLKAEAAALQDRVLMEFAHTAEAEFVLSYRWTGLSSELLFGQTQDTVAARAELSSMLWSFIDRPHHHRAELLGDAYGFLFRHLLGDATVSPDTLLLVARGAVDRSRYPLHAVVARGLAERGVHLDVAREIARNGIGAVEEFLLKSMEASLITPLRAAEVLDQDLGDVYSAIGYVELKAGDLAAARDAMNRALELTPNRPEIQFRTGVLAEAEGDVEAAEIHYAWGERYERLDPYADKANREALERIHTERHGSMEGYEEFVAGIMERDRDRRWQRVADSRISEPRELPAIELEWLAGGRIAAEELRGRIVVINFWGVWCGPCVAEAPQIQQLHEKYRVDPNVAFLTVNNDKDLDMVRRWMADKEYDYPTLLDDNFAQPYGVRAYPTTWFADADGRIVFEHVGVSAAVFEEFVWRVEMLRADAAGVTTADSAAAPVGDPAEPPADLESAIARVRSLHFGRDFHHGAAEGDAALERWPESSELAAWTVANLARSRTMPALSAYSSARAESLVASRPDDVWGAIALALALSYHNDRRGEALEASLRPLELAPTLPEAVWVRGDILHEHRQYRAVAALIEEKWPVVDRQWAALLTLKGNAYLRFEDGPERRAEGLEILARAREFDPENVNAHYLAGSALLSDRRVDEAAALLERAAALSPGSPDIVTFRWRAIQADPGLETEEKKKLISASASELLERRGQYPSTLRQVATQLGLWGLTAEAAELQDQVLTEFAHTVEAEWVLANRWERLSLRLLQGQVEDTVSAGAELSSMLWSFIDRPRHHQAELLGNAYRRLFSHLQRDETVSPDTLLLLARGAAEHNRFLPHAELAFGLAQRGVHLDAARAIASAGIDAAEENVSRRLEIYDTPGDAADALDRALANVHSAIGYVDLRAGDLVAAREAIDRALELKPDNPDVQFRAGVLSEAEGDLEAAEIHCAWGEREERLREQLLPGLGKPNRDALERIYTERHGSMEGYEEFIAGIEERDRDRRRQRVADSRIEEPRDLPVIELEWLDGGRIAAEELKGRIVVINFWGI